MVRPREKGMARIAARVGTPEGGTNISYRPSGVGFPTSRASLKAKAEVTMARLAKARAS